MVNSRYYEDEADNYNYEKGCFSTIEMNWVDKSRSLVIGERLGSYPGMNTILHLEIIIVGKDDAVEEVSFHRL